MLLVIDTNIIVNALKSKEESKSVQLMRDVFSGVHRMCVSPDILAEYDDVLHREYLQLPTLMVDRLLAWIKLNSYVIIPKPTSPREVEMRDEKDRMFFDVAKCLRIKLVTRNYRDYPVHELVILIDELY